MAQMAELYGLMQQNQGQSHLCRIIWLGIYAQKQTALEKHSWKINKNVGSSVPV